MAQNKNKTLEEQNTLRAKFGLQLIEIKIRKCNGCGNKFKSTGNRNCGCIDRNIASLQGYIANHGVCRGGQPPLGCVWCGAPKTKPQHRLKEAGMATCGCAKARS